MPDRKGTDAVAHCTQHRAPTPGCVWCWAAVMSIGAATGDSAPTDTIALEVTDAR